MRNWILLPFEFLFGIIALTSPGFAALPRDAQALLEELPGKAISLPVVLHRAMKASDRYQAIQASRYAVETPELRARAPLDWTLRGSVSHLTNRNEPSNGFSPTRIGGTTGVIGVDTYLPTGTGVSASVSHGANSLAFAQAPTSEYAESRASISVTQNLWKDGFGVATRKTLEQSRRARESLELAVEDERGEWVLQLVSLFYESWYAQRRVDAVSENYERRVKLLKTTRTKLSRGTAEKPDLAQVEHAVMVAESGRSETLQQLSETWRTLVQALKFPIAWTAIDPTEIPLVIEDSSGQARRACLDQPLGPPATVAVRRAALLAEIAELNRAIAVNRSRPDARLRLTLNPNGIDSHHADAFKELSTIEHPSLTVGGELSFPILGSAARADLRQAISDRDRARAAASEAEAIQKVQWSNACTELGRLLSLRARYVENEKSQRGRLTLEEERFRLGRVTLLNVIQAGDDAVQARLALDLTDMKLRLLSWRIRRWLPDFTSYLNELERAPGGTPS